MKRLSLHNTKGFTLVELLIVIVIIAILAAITIVAYNGITQRAKDSADVAALNQWAKSLYVYAQANGAYPIVTGTPCLTGDTAGKCARISGTDTCTGAGGAIASTTLITTLRSGGMTSIPELSGQTASCGNAVYAGVWLGPTVDGSTSRFYYVMPSSGSCPTVSLTTVVSVSQLGVRRCDYTMTSIN